MGCNNLCDRLAYPVTRPLNPYELGLKYCSRCERYFEEKGNFCPCCKRRLRFKFAYLR